MAKSSSLYGLLPLAAVALVIIGAAAVVLTQTPASTTDGSPSPTAPSGPATLTIFENDGKVHVVPDQGEARTCDLPPGGGRVTNVTADGIDILGGDGGRIRLAFDCTAADISLPSGLPNTDGTRGGRIGATQNDDAGTVVFSASGASDQDVVLRNASSRPYHDPTPIGWMDRDWFVVTAFRGDALYALAVQPSGTVSELVTIPEEAGGEASGDGAFWYVTVTPGPGIEFGPSGPSAIHRVGTDGKDVEVAQDAEGAIDGVLPGPDGRFAYTIGGTLFVGQGTTTVNAGTGYPLGWMDRTLLVSRSGRLSLVGPVDAVSGSDAISSTDTTIVLPEGVADAWRVTISTF